MATADLLSCRAPSGTTRYLIGQIHIIALMFISASKITYRKIAAFVSTAIAGVELMILPEPPLAKSTTLPSISVLCVDHDKDILLIVKVALSLDEQMEVRTESDFYAALEILAGTADYPDCILLEIPKSGLDSGSLLGKIREIPRHSKTPVIFLTSHVRDRDRQTCASIDPRGIIAKPFDPLTLGSTIRSILAFN